LKLELQSLGQALEAFEFTPQEFVLFFKGEYFLRPFCYLLLDGIILFLYFFLFLDIMGKFFFQFDNIGLHGLKMTGLRIILNGRAVVA
jgi:hypothetical protein